MVYNGNDYKLLKPGRSQGARHIYFLVMKQKFFMKISCSIPKRLKIKRFLLARKLLGSHLSTVVDLHSQSALRKMVLPLQEFKVKKHIQ